MPVRTSTHTPPGRPPHSGLGALAGASPLALRFLIALLRDPFLDSPANLRRHRSGRALLNPSQGELLRLEQNLKTSLVTRPSRLHTLVCVFAKVPSVSADSTHPALNLRVDSAFSRRERRLLRAIVRTPPRKGRYCPCDMAEHERRTPRHIRPATQTHQRPARL